jgi:molecular chaperone GrpE
MAEEMGQELMPPGVGGEEDYSAEVARLEEELFAERESHLRTLADFDNYRRRVRRESAAAGREGRGEVLLALLGVIDDFDRALTHAGEAPGAFADGLRLVRRRLDAVLQSNGVTPLESVGNPFDPNLHEAVSVVEGDGQESGVVHSEDSRGYLWDGELLRPSRVTVVK